MTIPLEKKYAPLQFALWRIVFGMYLLYYTLRIFPFREELFGPEGMMTSSTLNWTYGYFPDVLYFTDSPWVLSGIFFALGIAALAITLGVYRRSCALVAWFCLATLFNRNVLIEDPSLAFVGLLLIFLALIPLGEPYTVRAWYRRNTFGTEWYMPSVVYWGAWFVLALSFTTTGIDRLFSTTWSQGTALLYLFQQHITYDNVVTRSLFTLPPQAFKVLSWIPEIVYLASLPAIATSITRVCIWMLWVCMFVFVLVTLELTQVALGMLLYFAFIFDSAWLPFLRKKVDNNVASATQN